MAKPDFRTNEYGIDVADLEAGQWVEIKWSDAPNSVCLIIAVEERSPSYKGERSLDVLISNRKRSSRLEPKWRKHWATNSQVVRVIGLVNAPSVK